MLTVFLAENEVRQMTPSLSNSSTILQFQIYFIQNYAPAKPEKQNIGEVNDLKKDSGCVDKLSVISIPFLFLIQNARSTVCKFARKHRTINTFYFFY